MKNNNDTYQFRNLKKSVSGRVIYKKGLLLVVSLLMNLYALATIQLPNIPSQAEFNRQYEFNAEYAIQVDLSGSYLESGAIIAYVGNQIRGAQTTSETFPLTGDKVYKLRIYSNSASGETITLRYYDIFNDKIYEITEDISFEADAIPDYSAPEILHAFCPPPVVANLISPANDAIDVDTRVNFNWEGSAENSYYGLLLWKNGDSEPETPYISNITGTYRTVYNLQNATDYLWRIISYNGCNSDTSSTANFTTRGLPDLTVSAVTPPATVESATLFNIQFTVDNINIGATVENSWYDVVYISSDDIYDNNDLYLGRVRHTTQVLGNSNYIGSLDVTLPAEYNGSYYIIVRSDVYNNVNETNNDNNLGITTEAITVNRKALPDIEVTGISATESMVQPGDSVTISWTVENNTGVDAVGGWTEKVSLNTLTDLKVQLSGTPLYEGNLNAGESLVRSARFKIPNTLPFSGDTHLEVSLFPDNDLIEEPGGESNNNLVSTSTINIGSQLYIDIPTSSLVENSSTQLRCRVSRSSNPATPLEVTLNTDVADQITIPTTVTIPASNYSSIFYLSVIDNEILDGSRDVGITATAASHNDTTVVFTVHDNEVVSLSAAFNETEANEGDVLTLTISRNLITDQEVVVDLYSTSTRQWTFDKKATIPANEPSVDVTVNITDDDIAELTAPVTMRISSPGMNQTESIVNIKDDDIPGIELEIFTDTISESGGPYATWGILRKTDTEDSYVRVRLSTNYNDALFFPSEVTLPVGTPQKQFNLGAIDNGLVDGTRDVILTGAVYLSSCNCNTTAANGGVVSDTITVLDNDGPTLSVSFNPLSLPEGKENAGQVTVVRNTPTDSPLTVNLFHNDATELSLPATLTIPQGEISAFANISTINDDEEDGNQQVTIRAEAEGFTPGVGWIYVTDQNKPDLHPLDLTISSPTVVTGDQLEVRCQILNQGLAPSPTGFEVSVFLSSDALVDDNDDELGRFMLDAPIIPGEFTEFWELVTVPDKTGDYNILLKVNPNSAHTELIYVNNTTTPVAVVLVPGYNGMATVDEEQFIKPSEITIYGSATSIHGEAMPNVGLDVYLITNGIRQEIEVTTDESGNYTTTFEPLEGSAGHYIVGACYPDQKLDEIQDEFDILGMKRLGDRWVVWDILYNVDNTGNITLQNLSNVDLTEVKFITGEVPEGFELEIDTIDVLPGGGTAQFSYNIRGTSLTESNDYLQVPVQLVSNEGVELSFNVYYYCQAQQGHIKSLPSSINTTMTKGKSRLYEFRIFNDGAGETGEVAIDIPDFEWMSLLTTDTIPTILSGDTTTVTLQLSPGDDIPLNTPISGNIAINVDNGNNIFIPYRIEAVSEETGNLVVDVIDEYTYYTDEAPHVANAQVVIRHPFSGIIIAEGFTDSDGLFTVNDIPEGTYRMYIQADKHEGYQDVIYIDPGRTNTQSIFLSFQAITYTWEVIPTEIEDEYQIDLIMEFETNVPVPVVTIEMPKTMPALIGDETYTFAITLTNKGLITANDVELTLPTDDEYEFVSNYSVMDLLAQQAIQVPVIMRRKDAQTIKSASATQSSGSCSDYVITVYSYYCGDNGRWQQGSAMFSYTGRSCTGTGWGDPFGGGGGGGYGGGPSLGGGGGGGLSSSGGTPSISSNTTSCDECIEALAVNAIGCAGPYGNAFACGYSFGDGVSLKDVVMCGLGFTPIGCPLAILDALITCYGSIGGGPPGGFGGFAAPNLKSTQAGTIPPIIDQAAIDLSYIQFEMDAFFNYLDQYFGTLDWKTKESIIDFVDQVTNYIDNQQPISASEMEAILVAMADTDITPEEIAAFVARWNITIEAWNAGIYSPTEEYPDIVDQSALNKSYEDVQTVIDYTESRDFYDVDEMYNTSITTIEEQIDEKRGSVCASVTIKISQKLTMTREAFEGTLTIFNGNETTPMEEIELNLEIKDENGRLSNDLFEIETKALDILTGIDGTGTLGANQKGSATVLFIPEKGAAPTVPKSYSFGGSFSYLDPFTGTTVTKPLFPVTLDVHPSPDLFLHYFMQRDILGDDALTENVVEPIVPAELAVMIENNGYGQAKNVVIESAQPEIIENEKGLAIHFELIGSNLQGEPTQLGLINIDFGHIDPMTTKIGQWWFTSDLLGHFINYEAHVTHLDSRGNPDLSLVSGAELHELIKSIRIYGTQDDGINDFLVNEVQDSKETPDAIYISQGQVVLDVEQARTAIMTGFPTTGSTYLFASPEHIGWNYLKINDPGHGNFSIESVTRVSDGQEIPLDNMWLTHVTLPDGKEPVYEDKLHFVDNFPSMETEEYIITWKVNQGDAPKIVSITGTPDHMVTEQVPAARVIFNKPIDASTFDHEDLTLRLQGENDIMDASVTVTPVDAYTFDIDLTSLTTGDGYYVLTVQANEIYDQFGISGTEGKFVSWTQFLGAPAVQSFIGLPETLAGPPFNTLEIEFNIPVDIATVTPESFAISHYGSLVEGNLSVTHVSGDTLFLLSGLADFMLLDGEYTLEIDLTSIESSEGTAGLIQQTVSWKVDTTAPEVVEIRPSTDNGYDWQHYAEMEVEFSEGITAFTIEEIELWLDDVQQPLSQLHVGELDYNRYLLSQFRLLTYHEGNYTLIIHMEQISDSAGLTGSEPYEFTWTVDRSGAAPVENLRIAPDLGFSDADGITSTKVLDVIMDVPDNLDDIEIYQNDNGTLTQLAVEEGVSTGALTIPVVLPTGGHMKIEAHSVNATSDPAIASIPVFVDEAPLTAQLKGIPTTTVASNPSAIEIVFSKNIMETTIGSDIVSLTIDNVPVPLSGLAFTQVSDSIFTLSGLDLLPVVTGKYVMSVNISSLHKNSSGIAGVGIVNGQWSVSSANQAPIANAGEDMLISSTGTYNLDASGSSDPNNDALSYTWYAPEGFVLDDINAEMPEFTVDEAVADGVYTFILSVKDGKTTSTDKVDVVVSLTTDNNKVEPSVDFTLFPNPSSGLIYIVEGDVQILKILIFDADGRAVFNTQPAEDETIELNLQHLASGIYHIIIVSDEGMVTKKVVISK